MHLRPIKGAELDKGYIEAGAIRQPAKRPECSDIIRLQQHHHHRSLQHR